MRYYKQLIKLIQERFLVDPATAERVIGAATTLHSGFAEQDHETFDFILSVSYKFISLSDELQEVKRKLEDLENLKQFERGATSQFPK